MLRMLRGRQIYTSAIRKSKKFTTPIKLQICLPPYNNRPVTGDFASLADIKAFLQPDRFFVDPLLNKIITVNQLDRLNPDTVYDLVGGGFTYCLEPEGLSREQVPVVDKVFEEKATLALKEMLKKDDPGVVELPRVVQDKAGKDVGEWEAIFKSSNGCIIFLKAEFRMSLGHVFEQSEHMSNSLLALGKPSHAKLFLAAYFWHDDKSCISFTRNQGYGIIRPKSNLKDLTVEVMAVEKSYILPGC